MGLGKRLVLLAGTLAVFNFVLWVIPTIAPKVPDRYEGVSAAAPPVAAGTTPATTPPPLPSGFPSMERRPPKIEVPEGQSQPIATKFGLTYDIPADWDNWYGGVAGWTFNDGSSATYGSIGFYARSECNDGEYTARAMTGVSGRRSMDLDDAARAEVDKASLMFSDSEETARPIVTIDGPREFSVDGRPAIRYRAVVENIPQDEERCTAPQATFDVVTTAGYATAEVALFVVRADRDVDDALAESEISKIISSIRRS